ASVHTGWLRGARRLPARYIQERRGVPAGDASCPLTGPLAIAADSDTGVNVEMRFTCPASNATITYRSAAMVDFDPAARQAVMLWDRGDYTQVALLDSGRTTTMLRSRTWLGMPVDVIAQDVP